MRVLEPNHPWINHIGNSSWNHPGGTSAIVLSKGKNLIGDPKTQRSILADIPIGKGRLIYIGWDIAKSLPNGRLKSTMEQEEEYLRQYKIYEKLVIDLLEEE